MKLTTLYCFGSQSTRDYTAVIPGLQTVNAAGILDPVVDSPSSVVLVFQHLLSVSEPNCCNEIKTALVYKM